MTLEGQTLRVNYETLRQRAFGEITLDYQAVGTSLENPALILKLYNGTDVNLLISQNGADDHDLLPAGSSFTLDLNANQGPFNGLFLAKGQQIYVKALTGALPTSGAFYLTSLFRR